MGTLRYLSITSSTMTRAYSYQATETTIEALRQLRAPWQGVHITERAVTVLTTEGITVRITVEESEAEPDFVLSRICAAVVLTSEPWTPAEDFATGRNDIVLFAGATWSVGGGDAEQVVQFSGKPGQQPDDAEILGATTEAVVVAASTGTGLLLRVGIKPGTFECISDRHAIAAYVSERGYTG
ncbi:MAG: hypothetical protein JWO05_2558 [Gemmatimonadetes bacterium]|nr:hypothetical protein [Gemmatimonadota bacterium]